MRKDYYAISAIYYTVEISAFTLIATIFRDNYSDDYFMMLIRLITILTMGICTYYYQDKLRAKMFNKRVIHSILRIICFSCNYACSNWVDGGI